QRRAATRTILVRVSTEFWRASSDRLYGFCLGVTFTSATSLLRLPHSLAAGPPPPCSRAPGVHQTPCVARPSERERKRSSPAGCGVRGEVQPLDIHERSR